jgi:hypothetical protein
MRMATAATAVMTGDTGSSTNGILVSVIVYCGIVNRMRSRHVENGRWTVDRRRRRPLVGRYFVLRILKGAGTFVFDGDTS